VVQPGSLPLGPDDRYRSGIPHACTSVLVWPEGEPPRRDNCVVTDPCYPDQTYPVVVGALRGLGLKLGEVGFHFITHQHGDHVVYVPSWQSRPTFPEFQVSGSGPLSGLRTVPCPGHSPDMTALVFRGGDGEVWVVGDAVLDEEWLRAWAYFWPNGYDRDEVIQTWRSVALILSRADVVVPGHGPPIRVTTALLSELTDSFSRAEHAHLCPDVAETLRQAACRSHGTRT
jgi:glyoxylase-like metal-dependent hydrolase (beta-lactamase superfamily II)